jgi:uncharacterized protein
MHATRPDKPAAAPRPPSLKFRIYRQCRIWHGYLSAFAFAALLFFSTTGLILNHPDWFAGEAPPLEEATFTLTQPQLQEMRNAAMPGEILARIAGAHATLYGEYKDGSVAGDQVFVRLQGARGSSDIRANMTDGSVVVASEAATTVAVMNALHRGETAGAAWRLSIDVMAIVMIVVALAGYAIFLSMSGKLRTALLISAASIVAAVALFFAFVS